MAMIADLLRRIDYDVWANTRWLEWLEANGTDHEKEILQHILSASAVWLARIGGESPTEFPMPAMTPESIRHLGDRWKDAASSVSLDQVIEFRRLNGDENRLPFRSIVRHVANHGTYHRGHLRGLLDARGVEGFPETDFALFDMTEL